MLIDARRGTIRQYKEIQFWLCDNVIFKRNLRLTEDSSVFRPFNILPVFIYTDKKKNNYLATAAPL